MSLDVCDLYMYITNLCIAFPSKMLKCKILLNSNGQCVSTPVLDPILEFDEKESTGMSLTCNERNDTNQRHDDIDLDRSELCRPNRDERQVRSFILFSEPDNGSKMADDIVAVQDGPRESGSRGDNATKSLETEQCRNNVEVPMEAQGTVTN